MNARKLDDGTTVDLSACGGFVRITRPVPTGHFVTVSFRRQQLDAVIDNLCELADELDADPRGAVQGAA